MLVDTDKLIPVTKLQRELTQKLKEVSETGEPVYVLRNNEMAAVIVSAEEYELLRQAEEILEHLEIAENIDKRLKGHDRSKNIPWERIKKRHGLLGLNSFQMQKRISIPWTGLSGMRLPKRLIRSPKIRFWASLSGKRLDWI